MDDIRPDTIPDTANCRPATGWFRHNRPATLAAVAAALGLVVLLRCGIVAAQTKQEPPARQRLRLQAPQLGTADHPEHQDTPLLPRIVPGAFAGRAPVRAASAVVVQGNRLRVPELQSSNGTHSVQRARIMQVSQDPEVDNRREAGLLVLPHEATQTPASPTSADSDAVVESASTATAQEGSVLVSDERPQRPATVPPVPIPKNPQEKTVPGSLNGAWDASQDRHQQEQAVPLLPSQQRLLPDRSFHSNRSPVHGERPQVCSEHPGVSRFRANNELDAHAWMTPYRQRAHRSSSNAMDGGAMNPPSHPNPAFTAWWDGPVRVSTGMAPTAVPIRLEGLVRKAMLHSPQVLAIKTEPHVQFHVVGQEEARFDWSTFLEATFDDLKDPVGNTLALGVPGLDRLKDRNYSLSSGLRRRNRHGGEFEVSQRVGHQRQNSSFFLPNPQGSSRLELQYRQPVLNGAGAMVNQSDIVLARIAANASEDEVVRGLQDHLLQVTEAYWSLYQARAEFFQRQKLLQSAEGVLRRLTGRNDVDTTPRQILRARAAVARAQTGIQRTLSRVRDAEAQLRLLVNSPELLNTGLVELTPQLSPTMVSGCTELRDSLHSALQNRPDISEAIRQMRSSGVRLGVSRNELLPRLDLIVSSWVSDITNTPTSKSLRGQFTDSRPSYTVGLEFEVPLGNRAARSKLEQRKWELKRSINVFRATVEKALTDVEIAHREVATAWSEVLSRFQAMTAAQNETSYLQDRFTVLPMAEDSAILLLEDLLDSFERVSDEESAFVQAQVAHAVAIIQLRRETGTLLRTRESRPQLDAVQSQWMSARVESSAAAETEKSETSAPDPRQRDRPVAHTRAK